jgi:hypothetical protein
MKDDRKEFIEHLENRELFDLLVEVALENCRGEPITKQEKELYRILVELEKRLSEIQISWFE